LLAQELKRPVMPLLVSWSSDSAGVMYRARRPPPAPSRPGSEEPLAGIEWNARADVSNEFAGALWLA